METYTYSRWVHRLMTGLIFALALLQPFSVSTSSHTSTVHFQSYPDIKGTWYVNGDVNQVVTITQNGASLYFASSQYSSNGQFVDQRRIYASDWNTYATLSDDLNTITWDNQVWTRATQQRPSVYDLSGNWYVNGDANQVAIIIQNGNQLSFTVGGNSSNGYFYSANQVQATAWNAIANISDDGNTLTWGNQTWNRAPVQGIRTQNYCRRELSLLYWMSQTLGTAWVRASCSPTFAGQAQQDVYNSLDYVQLVLNSLTCIQYRTENIELMVEAWAFQSKEKIVRDIEALIRELQEIIANVDWQCDNNVNPVQLYIAGVHLGAAQAWASCELCKGRAILPAIQNSILAHLTTARNAANTYALCIPDFDFNSFQRVTVNSNDALVPHTQIVGIETLIFWSIAMSDCCCRCTGAITPLNPVDNDRKCHDDCLRYCKSLRDRNYTTGRWDGVHPCLGGIVTNKGAGCKCQ